MYISTKSLEWGVTTTDLTVWSSSLAEDFLKIWSEWEIEYLIVCGRIPLLWPRYAPESQRAHWQDDPSLRYGISDRFGWSWWSGSYSWFVSGCPQWSASYWALFGIFR